VDLPVLVSQFLCTDGFSANVVKMNHMVSPMIPPAITRRNSFAFAQLIIASDIAIKQHGAPTEANLTE
jgi:hypothetical protein